MITTITSHNYHFFFVMGTLKIYSLSNFQVCNMVLLTIIIMPYITSPEHILKRIFNLEKEVRAFHSLFSYKNLFFQQIHGLLIYKVLYYIIYCYIIYKTSTVIKYLHSFAQEKQYLICDLLCIP